MGDGTSDSDWKEGIRTKLFLIRVNSKSLVYIMEESSSLLHNYYMGGNSGYWMDSKQNKRDKLCADLATGDFDGDGYDDIACISYINCLTSESEWSNRDINYKYGTPKLRVGFGGPSSEVLELASGNDVYVNDGGTVDDDEVEYKTLYAPSVVAADLDNDNVDEIIVGGFQNTITADKSSEKSSDLWNCSSKYIGIYAYNANKDRNIGMRKYARAYLESNAWTEDGVYPSRDDVWAPAGLEAVRFNGVSSAPTIFMNGSFYSITKADLDNNGAVEAVYTPEYFKHSDNGVGSGTSVEEVFIRSAVAGNFEEDGYGYEQIYFVVGLKTAVLSRNTYFISMVGYDHKDDKYYYKQSPYVMENESDTLANCMNCELTACDRDYDGVMARYHSTIVQHTDPEVVAILQASPHFSDLGDYMPAGTTSYSITTAYEYGQSESEDYSFSFGAAIEGDTGIGLKIEFNGGPTWGWTESWENSLSKSYTYTVETANEDIVVLKRTPLYTYYYDVQKSDGEWQPYGYFVSVPKEPGYVAWSVDEYNDFVDYYNEAMSKNNVTGKDFAKVTTEWVNTGGDPNRYATSNAGFYKLSAQSIDLGYNGSTVSSTYSFESSETHTKETSHGYDLEVTFKCGGELPGGAEFWGGVFYSHSGNFTTGSYTTTINGTETSGSVVNIDGLGLSQIDIGKDTYSNYFFNWTFGEWLMNLGVCKNVPFVGYVLSGVRNGLPCVEDLTASCTLKDYTLKWSDVEDAAGYDAYMIKDGKYIKLNDAPIASGAEGWTVRLEDEDAIHTFVVRVIYSNDRKSMYSNEATTVGLNVKALEEYLSEHNIGGKGIVSIELLKSEGLVDTYQITYSDGSKTTFTVRNGADGANGKDGRGISSITVVEQNAAYTKYRITYSDETFFEFTVNNGKDGKDGRNGIDGINGKNGINGIDGKNGKDGLNGIDGRDGISIISASIDDKGHLIIKYSDGKVDDVGRVVGKDGKDGKNGINGVNGKDGIITYYYFAVPYEDVKYIEVDGKPISDENYNIQDVDDGTLVALLNNELPANAKKLTVVGSNGSQSVELNRMNKGSGVPWWVIVVLAGWNTGLTAGMAVLFKRQKKETKEA